jgi:aquaporin Z
MCLTKRAAAEFIGTFWLVLGGCGSALLACGANNFGIGYVGVSIAFGLTVLTMAYAIGHISGCHLNPAVTLGLVAAGRFTKDPKDIIAYIIAQCAGGIAAAALLLFIANPDLTAATAGTFATNGWSNELVNGFNAFGGKAVGMGAAFVTEAVLTCIFLLVIIGATDKRAPAGFAPIAIGLCLTLIHLISIPVTNTSVNPARSAAMAVFTMGEPIQQLWLFWLAPIAGAIIAGIIYKCIFEEKSTCCCGKSDSECCKKNGGECKCNKKADNVKTEDKKADNAESKKADNAENKKADDAESKKADDAEDKKAE